MAKTQLAEPTRSAKSDELHLIYKVEGRPNEVELFELSRALQGIGEVLREANRLTYPQTDVHLHVRPFTPGSFIMDIAVQIQQNPAFLSFLTNPELLKHAKEILEYIGLIKKVGEAGESLIELLKKLKNGKPEAVVPTGDHFEYKTEDGATLNVSAPVNNLYNSGVVNNYIFNIAAPAEGLDVQGIKMFLKGQEKETGVEISREDVPALKAYSHPELLAGDPEVLENTSIYMLHPKSGNYGGTSGQWTFTIAGSRRVLKARITDKSFLKDYTDGSIRFYAQDLLKARVRELQVVQGSKVKVQNDLIEVIHYRPAHPSERT